MPSYTRKVSIPGKSSQELYDRVSEGIEGFLEKAAVGKVDLDRDPSRKEFRIHSSMFQATLNCQDSEVSLHAKLSLMAAPFKSKIDGAITRWIEKTFDIKA